LLSALQRYLGGIVPWALLLWSGSLDSSEECVESEQAQLISKYPFGWLMGMALIPACYSDCFGNPLQFLCKTRETSW